ncbi:GNAT family N-acetyltransferase [Sphingobacterium deserti]|uniref:GNAT family acetyltransferase n=1 Tax=Sphingobacterium deserti TaxID=1229276 RepID=A0A0B8TAW3_9SPHI|nr:GNAT family N-acetyltransferase [Sphingobacterium deserti]KGE16004.1 GNAT family acetyltransferase [Sphingobacterium deserti]
MRHFETERLILKPASPEDAVFFLQLYNTPKFIQFIGDRNLRTIEDAEQYIRNRFRPQIDRLGFGNYVVVLRENQQKIGAVGIFEREGLDVMDIGFSFLEAYEGKGYGYESAFYLKEIIQRQYGVQRISAITSKDNYPSQKLIEKLGLTFRKFVTLPDETEELRYYESD